MGAIRLLATWSLSLVSVVLTVSICTVAWPLSTSYQCSKSYNWTHKHIYIWSMNLLQTHSCCLKYRVLASVHTHVQLRTESLMTWSQAQQAFTSPHAPQTSTHSEAPAAVCH